MIKSLICTACGKDVKKIGFWGFGLSNRRIFEMLLGTGCDFLFSYRGRHCPDIPSAIPKSRCYTDGASLLHMDEDIIFLSPSVRRTPDLLSAAAASGTVLYSDTELFFLSKPKNVLAVTGSDGKSTVTYLTARLTENTLGAVPSGNFGLPLCSLIGGGEYRGAVVELSSFQLQYTAPRVSRALITNISENHLNWHSDLNEYVEAKKNLFKNADMRAITLGDEFCERIAEVASPDVIISKEHTERELCSLYSPTVAVTLESGYITVNGEYFLSLSDIKLKEEYNVKNFMSAIGLAFGLTDKDTARLIAMEFSGLPHRKELFITHGGVDYYDSSIDSTPTRTEKTLLSLKKPAVVIVGGAAKGLSYLPLIRALSERARAVVLTGASADRLFELLSRLSDFTPEIYMEPDFTLAAQLAVRIARRGEAVILSPAHTSYDAFASFEKRGEKFKEIIKNTID